MVSETGAKACLVMLAANIGNSNILVDLTGSILRNTGTKHRLKAVQTLDS